MRKTLVVGACAVLVGILLIISLPPLFTWLNTPREISMIDASVAHVRIYSEIPVESIETETYTIRMRPSNIHGEFKDDARIGLVNGATIVINSKVVVDGQEYVGSIDRYLSIAIYRNGEIGRDATIGKGRQGAVFPTYID